MTFTAIFAYILLCLIFIIDFNSKCLEYIGFEISSFCHCRPSFLLKILIIGAIRHRGKSSPYWQLYRLVSIGFCYCDQRLNHLGSYDLHWLYSTYIVSFSRIQMNLECDLMYKSDRWKNIFIVFLMRKWQNCYTMYFVIHYE